MTTEQDQRWKNYEFENTYVSRNEVELDLNPVKRWNPIKAQFLGEGSKTADFLKVSRMVRVRAD